MHNIYACILRAKVERSIYWKNNHSISLRQNQVILDIATEKRCRVQVAILFVRDEDISKLLQSAWYLM